MTNQEAINVLLNEQKCINRNDGIQCDRKCGSCDLAMDAEPIREAYNMAISALQAQDVPDTNVGKIECDYVVSAVAVEEMLKNLLPVRGMWEIEGDEAKNAICETVYDALKGLWKLPFARPEIIFCEECRHWDGEKRGQFYYFERCSLHRCSALSNNFCSWAERLEE